MTNVRHSLKYKYIISQISTYRFLQGVAAKLAKNSSVKKLLLLGVVPGIPENYFNVKAILSSLNIEEVGFTVSADVKMCKSE